MRRVPRLDALAGKFPRSEPFEFSSRLRRAASSVPAHLAEGTARRGTGDDVRHAGYARGRLADVETHPAIAVLLEFLQPGDIEGALAAIAEVRRIVQALIESLERRLLTEPRLAPGIELAPGVRRPTAFASGMRAHSRRRKPAACSRRRACSTRIRTLDSRPAPATAGAPEPPPPPLRLSPSTFTSLPRAGYPALLQPPRSRTWASGTGR
jgi:four helix bundle protein